MERQIPLGHLLKTVLPFEKESDWNRIHLRSEHSLKVPSEKCATAQAPQPFHACCLIGVMPENDKPSFAPQSQIDLAQAHVHLLNDGTHLTRRD